MSKSIAPRSRTAVKLLAIVFLFPIMVGLTKAVPETGDAVPSPAKQGGHLFILSGQSNMTGGLKEGFAKAAKKALGDDKVTIAFSMRSGRGIRFWVEDYALPEDHELAGKLTAGNGSEYPRLLQAVRDAGDARSFETVTLIWMQGESDANRDLAVAYAKSFNTLLGHLKADLGLKQIHFVIGRISDHGLHGDTEDAWKRMREVQVRLAEADALGAWINTDDLNGGDKTNPHGELHYPPDKTAELGERFAEAAVKLLLSGHVSGVDAPAGDK